MALLLLLAAFLSGCAALVAETLWFRALGRGVGTSAEALAVVSAAFLGGLGLGAWVASRRAPRAASPVRAAAICEAVAGLLILASPVALAWVPDAHLAVLGLFGLEPGPSSWPAALVALPILVLPTAFLGATLPFLVRGQVRRLGAGGRWTGALYASNTVGAAAGVATALVLLPRLGESLALRVAGAGNLIAALILLLAERPAPAAEAGGPSDRTPVPGPASIHRGARAPFVALFLSGAMALGAEVAWFRLLEPLTGVHLYGFAVLLISVLLGTAAGGAIGGRLADAVRRPDLALAVTIGLGALATLASIVVAGEIPWRALHDAGLDADAARAAKEAAEAITAAGQDAIVRTRLLGAALTVVPALVALSAAYPLAVRARARSLEGVSEAAGSVYAWNTVGNAAGSLLAGFVLLPRLGGPATLVALGGAGLAGAAALWLVAARSRAAVGALAFLAPLGLLCVPSLRDRLESSGPTLPEIVTLARWWDPIRVDSRADMKVLSETIGGTYPRPPGRPDAPQILPREGVVGTVGLLLEKNSIRLRQAGLSESKIVPSDPDQGSDTEVALALLPYLLHADPKTALVIGHGAGWTVETMLAATLEHVDVAELEPAVLETVEAYRGRLAIRDAKNARLWTTDGRLLLRRSAHAGGTYDLIVSQPSHPWVPGAGSLFNRDAYQLARSALRVGGVFAQWVNIFNMREELFLTALASFRDVFPECWVLLYADEVILVGFTAPPHVDVARWDRAFTQEAIGVRARAAGIAGPADLLRRLAADGSGLTRVIGTAAAVSTDDDPRLETGLAWTMFTGAQRLAGERAAIYQDLRRGLPPAFEAFLPDAVARDALLARTAVRVVETASVDDAKRWLTAVSFEGGVDGRRARARASAAQARVAGLATADRKRLQTDALEYAKAALELAPTDLALAREALEARLALGPMDVAVAEGLALVARFPGDGILLEGLARGYMGVGREDAAVTAFGIALAARGAPPPAGTGLRLARLLLSSESPRSAEARAALRADAGTQNDRDALESLTRLEIELAPQHANGDTAEAREAERRRKDLDRQEGLDKIDAARALVDGDRDKGLEAAKTATSRVPDESLAWRLQAWFELRGKDADAALASLARAIATAKDPAAETARARAYLRLFSVDPSRLEEKTP